MAGQHDAGADEHRIGRDGVAPHHPPIGVPQLHPRGIVAGFQHEARSGSMP